MCELFCLSSRIPTRATFSARRFADHGAPEGTTVDGWGFGFYDGLDVRLYKEPEPAGSSHWLELVEQRGLISKLIVAHIRRATTGSISLANTQPFLRELGGRAHLFAHNGRQEGIADTTQPRHHRPIGETDSELAYCALLGRLAPLWRAGVIPPLDDRMGVIATFASEMRKLGPANFLYSDGDVVFAHGHRRIQKDGVIAPPGLWLLERACPIDTDASATRNATANDGQRIVVIASVPLTDERWRPLTEGELIVLRNGQIVKMDDACRSWSG